MGLKMNLKSIRALIALNVVLLVGLFMTMITPEPAAAQGLNPGNYMMVAGDIAARKSQQIVYIVDLSNSRIGAAIFTSANKQFEMVAVRSILEDVQRRR